jgi:hypothetical protein
MRLLLIAGQLCTGELWHEQQQGLSDLAEIHIAKHTGADTVAKISAAILSAAPERFSLCAHAMGNANSHADRRT